MSNRRRPGPGDITDEDAELWHQVTRSVERARLKPRAHPSKSVIGHARSEVHRGSSADAAAAENAARQRPISDRGPEHRPHHPAVSQKPKSAGPRPTPGLAIFERKRARRIAGGRTDIDARIDLHGMRQSEAHPALAGFLRAAYARGDRNVLVITGKGGSEREGYDEIHSSRGVLKQNVPRWLAEPELRQIVVSYTSAARHHGGDGALYIQLRAHRKT